MAIIKKKAQKGTSIKPTADSTNYYLKKGEKNYGSFINSLEEKNNKKSTTYKRAADKAFDNAARQSKKGKPGYDANGFPKKKCGGKVSKKKK